MNKNGPRVAVIRMVRKVVKKGIRSESEKRKSEVESDGPHPVFRRLPAEAGSMGIMGPYTGRDCRRQSGRGWMVLYIREQGTNSRNEWHSGQRRSLLTRIEERGAR